MALASRASDPIGEAASAPSLAHGPRLDLIDYGRVHPAEFGPYQEAYGPTLERR